MVEDFKDIIGSLITGIKNYEPEDYESKIDEQVRSIIIVKLTEAFMWLGEIKKY